MQRSQHRAGNLQGVNHIVSTIAKAVLALGLTGASSKQKPYIFCLVTKEGSIAPMSVSRGTGLDRITALRMLPAHRFWLTGQSSRLQSKLPPRAHHFLSRRPRLLQANRSWLEDFHKSLRSR